MGSLPRTGVLRRSYIGRPFRTPCMGRRWLMTCAFCGRNGIGSRSFTVGLLRCSTGVFLHLAVAPSKCAARAGFLPSGSSEWHSDCASDGIRCGNVKGRFAGGQVMQCGLDEPSRTGQRSALLLQFAGGCCRFSLALSGIRPGFAVGDSGAAAISAEVRSTAPRRWLSSSSTTTRMWRL